MNNFVYTRHSYLLGSDLVSGMAANTGHAWDRIYEPVRDLIATVHNRSGNRTISRFDYTNDEIGRRTAITRTGSAFSSLSGSVDHYGYNDRSEVVSVRRTLNGEEVRGFSFGYAYDPIGNRTSSTEWDENGVAHTSHYTANELNEYESRTVPGHVTVLGEAATDAIVTVNGNPAWRKGAYFVGGDSFDNTSSNVFAELATTAVRSTAEVDEEESSTGNKFLPKTPEAFTYDDDGNMTSDGRFIYTWDAENRLTGVETRNDFGMDIPHVRVENGYDHQFRRACKRVWTNSVLDKQTVFIYDDWNMIVENASSTTHHDVNIYMWGLDITGSRKSAGGVGGLLARFNDCSDMIPLYDGNGNISEWIIDGIETNHAEYSPFGGFVVGSNPRESTFAFSTKYYDKEMDLYSFPFKYFSPSSGRRLSRDVVGEEGGASLFSFVANSPITYFDPFGQKFWSWETLGDALDIVGGGAMIVAGVAVGTAASWTGFGAVAGGLLVAYGGDTLLKGSTSLGNRLAGGNGFDETPVQWSYHYVAEQITGETESGLSITLDCFYFAREFATTCFSGYEYYKSIRLTIRQLGPIKIVPELYVNESGFLRQIEYLEGGGFIRDYLGGMIYHTFGELRDVITVGEDFYDLITIDGVSTPIDDQGSSTNNQPNPEPEF